MWKVPFCDFWWTGHTVGEGATIFLFILSEGWGIRELEQAQKLVHVFLPHVVHFIPYAPCFHSHYCPLIVWWVSMALLQGTCVTVASALPLGLIAPTKLILLPHIRAHSIRDIFKHSCIPPTLFLRLCELWDLSCNPVCVRRMQQIWREIRGYSPNITAELWRLPSSLWHRHENRASPELLCPVQCTCMEIMRFPCDYLLWSCVKLSMSVLGTGLCFITYMQHFCLQACFSILLSTRCPTQGFLFHG